MRSSMHPPGEEGERERVLKNRVHSYQTTTAPSLQVQLSYFLIIMIYLPRKFCSKTKPSMLIATHGNRLYSSIQRYRQNPCIFVVEHNLDIKTETFLQHLWYLCSLEYDGKQPCALRGVELYDWWIIFPSLVSPGIYFSTHLSHYTQYWRAWKHAESMVAITSIIRWY